MIPVGLSLQPDDAFLDLLHDVIREDVDYAEVAPETLWRASPEGELSANGFFARFVALREASGMPFVAHGVGFSAGSPATTTSERARRARWLARIALDRRALGYLWYTDHLGMSAPGGFAATLPLGTPMDAHGVRVLQRSLLAMQKAVPDVGIENSVLYFVLGDPLDEARFLREALRAPRTHLLLDLHNVFTMGQNLGFDPDAYVERLDLAKVIEIHLSGGAESDPAWLPSGKTLRLDAHDSAVPEPVWTLFERIAPRCPNLRGVTLERMEGTVTTRADTSCVREELRRARRVLARAP